MPAALDQPGPDATLSEVLGLTMGGISGYFGGAADMPVQRVIEVIMSFPTIPRCGWR